MTAPSPSDKYSTGIYVASRVSRADVWLNLRDNMGLSITSSWIDEAGEGETADFGELWTRIRAEIARSTGLVFYADVGDAPWKGALVEIGIALALDKPVAVLLMGNLEGRTFRPVGSWIRHPKVQVFAFMEGAVEYAQSGAPLPELQQRWIPVGDSLPPPYKTVLLDCDGELQSTGHLKNDGGFLIDAEDHSDGSRWIVTHWRDIHRNAATQYRMGESQGAPGNSPASNASSGDLAAARPRSTYTPHTEREIELIRAVLDDGTYTKLEQKDIGILCDMAQSSLLYGEEIHRLRDGAVSATMPSSVVNDPTNWNPSEEFDGLEFASYTNAKKAEVLFNRLVRERDAAIRDRDARAREACTFEKRTTCSFAPASTSGERQNAGMCMYCGEVFRVESDAPADVAKVYEITLAHDRTCQKNPIAKDAARYRWLRHDSGNVKTEEMKSNLMVYQGARMDELIDKQMFSTTASATLASKP